MIAPAVEAVVVPVVAIVVLATVISVFEAIMIVIISVIMVSVMLMPITLIILAPARPDTVLIMRVMMWKIIPALTIAIIIVFRSFTVIISVHNGIAAAIGSVTGIISIVL